LRLKSLPPTLLDDIVAGRCIPIVGAGFSKNARVPPGTTMPAWRELGNSLARDARVAVDDPTEAASIYAHRYGRPALHRRLRELLLYGRAEPDQTHRSFCELPFDIVCTTNFDLLLDDTYRSIGRVVRPVVDEADLVTGQIQDTVTLIKLHGDLDHEASLVVTEDDYDRYVPTHPLLATFLSSLLITRTALLIGYSASDPDFRQLWHVIKSRLGGGHRIAYALAPGADANAVERFSRRDIQVLSA
jgi:hypothetical protein